MVNKPRPVPNDLIIFRLLNKRMNLTENDKQYYLHREKGFEGEVMFDKLTEKLITNECHILRDLLLEINNTEFQIDSTIIQKTVKIFEVKNYEGDYYYESGKFYTSTGKMINDPLDQLSRSLSLLRQYIQSLNCNLTVEGYVVFVNPEFALLQAPRDKPIILPSQLNRFIKKLNMLSTNLSEKHTKLANQLIAGHKSKSRNSLLPQYKYEHLKKGVTCATCNSFQISVGERKLVCRDCGAEENVEAAVLRCVEELKLLFPEMKITTNLVFEWCKVIKSKKRISRILNRNYKIMGHARSSYYE
jgi:hypothetical protein